MGILEEPVEDRVAEGRISDKVVPVFHGDLAAEDRAAGSIAIEEVVTVLAHVVSEQGLSTPFAPARRPPSARHCRPHRAEARRQ